MKNKYFYILLLLAWLKNPAQKNDSAFLSGFAKASWVGKLKMTANRDFGDINTIYPLIKDTLENIRKKTYQHHETGRIKYLLDRIDANRQVYYKNYARAIFIMENSLRHHIEGIDDSLRCLVTLKTLFLKIKDYSKAMELHHLIELKWPYKTDTATIYFGPNKSSIYFQIGLYEKAISERRKEYLKSPTPNDSSVMVSYYNDVGVFYNYSKNADSAKAYFLKAKKILETFRNPKLTKVNLDFFKALVDGNLGQAYYNGNKFHEAIPLLKRDVYYSLKAHNYGSALSSYLVLIECYLKLNQNKFAKTYLDTSRTIVNTKIQEAKPKLKFLLVQADYYSKTGDYRTANDSYRQYADLNNETMTSENEQRMLNEKMSMSVDQKEAELAQRDDMLKRIQLQEARQKSSWAYLLAGALALVLIIIFLLLNTYNSRKREEQLFIKNTQIGTQKFQIEQSLKEKDMLIKEIHHRVKNNLQIITSMLSLQIAKVEDDKTGAILRDAKQRISSIALTHQMLYQKENLSNVNLGEYLERLARQVELIMPPSGVELETNIPYCESRLSIDNAVPLGLLVNELLTNAYKHAFPANIKGKIVVTLLETDDSFTLSVSDNGVGLPENFADVERKTLGMELIYILAEQLDSSLLIENASGSSFRLNVKKT